MKNFSSTLILITLSLTLIGCEGGGEQKKGQYLEQGIVLFDQGKYKESELKIKNAIQEDPSIAEPYYYMALLNEKGKKYKAMRASLLETVKLDSEKTKAKLKLAKVHLLFNDLDASSKEIESVLAKNPEQLDALAIKSSLLMRQKKIKGALIIIDEILKKDSEHIEAISLKTVTLIKQKDFDQALALLTPALQKNSDNISLHLLKIQIDSQKNDTDAVIADYEKLVEMKPDNVQIKLTLAKVYQTAKKPKKAEEILNQLIQDNPRQINLKIALLNFLYASDEEKAASKFDVFFEENKDNYKEIIVLSKWLVLKDKKTKAQNILTSTLSNNNVSDENKTSITLFLAKFAFTDKDTTKALSYIDKILDKNTEDVNAKTLKAEILISLNKISDAKKLLEEVLWQQPKMDLALSLLGGINQIEGDLDKAIINYENALKLNPNNLQALSFIVNKEVSENHSEYAIEILEHALRQLPNNLKILTQLVELNFNAENYELADKYITKIQIQKNGVFLANYLKANSLHRQQKYNKAISAYKSLLEKAPWLKDALTGMADCYIQLNQQSEMMVYLERLIKNNPNNTFPSILKSQLLTADKKYKKAISFISSTLKKQTIKNTAFHSELGRLYGLTGDKKNQYASYIEGLKINPKNIKIMLSLASSYEKDLVFDKALELYEKILSINPIHNTSKNNLATLLLDHFGKPEDVNKATKIVKTFKQSKHPYFLDTYGWAKLKSGEVEDALAIFKKVIIIAPNTPIFRYHLAVAYNLTGNNFSAISELKQALYIGKGRKSSEKVLIEELIAKLKSN